MSSNLEIMRNIRSMSSQVQICEAVSSSKVAGLYEIERAMSIIDSVCDAINSNLEQCDKILKDGKHNLIQVESVINSSRMIDSLKHSKEALASISAKMNSTQQSVESLHNLRFAIEKILRDMKLQLQKLSSDESTDRQKVLTLYNHTLKPLYRMTYENEYTDFESRSYNYSNADGYSYGDGTDNSDSYYNIPLNNVMSNLSSLPNMTSEQYDQIVSQDSIPANSLSNSRIRRGASGEDGIYSLRKRSNILLRHKRGSQNDVISSKVIETPEVKEIAKWLHKVNPGFSPEGENGKFIPYNHNCGSCAYAVEKNLSGTSESFEVSTLYSYRDEEMEEKTGKTCRYMRREDIEEYLKSQGPGAHLIVGIDREPALFGLVQRAGHWFNVYYDGTQIVTVDGQCNKIFGWPPEYGHISRWCAMI